MANKAPKINRWNGRAHSFALLSLAAMHRSLRWRCLSEARRYGNTPLVAADCRREADRHAEDARRRIASSRGFSHVEVLP